MRKMSKYRNQYAEVLRSHIVMCHTLLPADLSRPRNLTSLSGLVLTTGFAQVTPQRQGSLRPLINPYFKACQ